MYNEIKNDLLTLPLQIKKAEEEIIKKDQSIKEKEFVCANLKQTIIEEVVNEKTKEDKNKYTNEKARTAEINNRLGISFDYKSIQEEVIKLKSESANEKIYISFLKRRFIAAESLTRM